MISTGSHVVCCKVNKNNQLHKSFMQVKGHFQSSKALMKNTKIIYTVSIGKDRPKQTVQVKGLHCFHSVLQGLEAPTGKGDLFNF